MIGDRRVERGIHAGLEQERDLDHRRAGPIAALREFLPPLHDPGTDPRPQHPLQPLPVLRGRERPLGEGRPVH